MNKTELIAAVAEKTSMTKKDTESVISTTLETIVEALVNGDKVQIPGFGIFEVKHREARTGRNPVTGEAMEIAATDVPAFKPGKAMKDAVAK